MNEMTPTELRDALKAGLSPLSDDLLAYIHHAQYEVTGQLIMDVVEDIIWDRHATIGGDWPVSPPVDPEMIGQAYYFQLLYYCAKATGPDDPAHRPARILDVKFRGHHFGGIGFECTCGSRPKYSPAKQHRVSIPGWDTHVWPRVVIDRVPYFVVCKHARYPFDLAHAPCLRTTFDERCLCGEAFPDLTNTDRAELELHYKLWPAQ